MKSIWTWLLVFVVLLTINVISKLTLLDRFIPSETTTHNLNDKDPCWPISIAAATGNVRCWSSGKLVYHQYIYHNGGIVCSATGLQIKINNRTDFCVIESNQDDVWNPPTK